MTDKAGEAQGKVSPGGSSQKAGVSPAELDFVMQCYWNPDPVYRSEEITKRFLDDGIIKVSETDHKYKLTIRGKVWVEAILATPYPELAWIDNAGRITYARR